MWHLRQARFSPDGEWIAFYAAKTPEKRHIYIVPAAGPSRAPEDWIPVVTDVGSQASWAPDGSAIYYVSERDGALCVWVQSLDPLTKQAVGPPRVVQHFHEPRLRGGTTAIATNECTGGYLYITLTETTGNIWMLERRRE